MQMTLTHFDYVRPGCDCQSISVSQYLPGVIRVDGVINKGKLQVCKQPPPSGSSRADCSACLRVAVEDRLGAEPARRNKAMKTCLRTVNRILRFLTVFCNRGLRSISVTL